MRVALLVGISGTTGKVLIESLLNNRHYKKVILLSRRENRKFKNIHLKKVKVDFSDIQNHKAEFEGVDDVFCLLGMDFINTHNLEDASMFEYEYPYQLAKVAKEAGVKNFFLLNPSKASQDANNQRLKLRAKLELEINRLKFDNFYLFKVNSVSRPVNLDSSLFAARKSLSNLINLVGMGLMDKIKPTPANILVNKMIEAALRPEKAKKEYLPSDY